MAISAQIAKVRKAVVKYQKSLGLAVPKLKGRGAWDRVMVFDWISKYIPDDLQAKLYFTGQGNMTIIPKSLATCIAKELDVPFNLFAVEV